MSNELQGRKIAFLAASGVEQIELTEPWTVVEDAGGAPVLVGTREDEVHAFHHDVDKGDTFRPDVMVDDATVADFGALVLPGGTTNPDRLRTFDEAVEFVRGFARQGKPVAAICHGPWTLVEAGVLRGKELTSWPSLQTDIRNAGGEWQDREVVVCERAGWTLVTSRKPDDLPAFTDALLAAFAQA
ncbi:type 1 glutamine amidotransferase domain-containing protein [Flexivirga oryzae]|uniref:Protease I n=1 Tax=Flexivirga oryzae TaxID=1794944 RepID=A0A839N791_9MICO|nr:type 1 glutamine amidotransferase domain-containing protein [Flexivirga oryzae]MBB2891506.1 protease I [Flexivirga oryzae]